MAKQQPVAQFSAGHTASANNKGLQVFAPDGTHRATFHGAGAHSGAIDRGGGQLHIFAATPRTRDEDRLLILQDELRRINMDNAEFWQRRKGMSE